MLAEAWLVDFKQALLAADKKDLRALFYGECFWRDVIGASWRIETLSGQEAIATKLCETAHFLGAWSIEIDNKTNPPRWVYRVDRECLEVFFHATSDLGHHRGLLRLLPNDEAQGKLEAWTLLTSLEALTGHEETIDHNRPTGNSHSRDFRGPNWLDQRQAEEKFEDDDPTVLIVGGGQAGLSIAARLKQLDVPCLIVDTHERIGDNWRKRYHALTLHNQVHVNHLPYMPFPPTWPVYIPKDKLANWFESYVDALELNYWTDQRLVAGSYDQASQLWSVELEDGAGERRSLKPRHVILATGVSGIPNIPDIPGLDQYKGQCVHSSAYHDGEDWTGKKAMVIGTGNSGHDISQDLASSGAEITMVQRSPTLIVNLEPSAQLPYALYSEGYALEDCDYIVTSMPTELSQRSHMAMTVKARELDKDLLQGLQDVGFKLDLSDGSTGWQFKYLTRGGGYYFNVGCSDMLVNGQIALSHFDDIERFDETGVIMKDGSHRDLDLIVLATGYKDQSELVAHLFGREMADRVGPIWGFGPEMELRNMYNRTNQPGLYFIAGSLAQCRINSKYLALQIKALELGLIEDAEL